MCNIQACWSLLFLAKGWSEREQVVAVASITILKNAVMIYKIKKLFSNYIGSSLIDFFFHYSFYVESH